MKFGRMRADADDDPDRYSDSPSVPPTDRPTSNKAVFYLQSRLGDTFLDEMDRRFSKDPKSVASMITTPPSLGD